MEMQEKPHHNPYYQCYDNKNLEKSQPDLSNHKADEAQAVQNSNNSTLVAQNLETGQDGQVVGRPTSYLETMMHLFKGNVGPGCFAMGDAFKNGGLILAPILTLILGVVCVHAQHVLVICSEKIRIKYKFDKRPDYAETVELCFESGPENLRKYSKSMKTACNVFIVVTQLGFCCIYILFIGTNLKQVLDFYGVVLDLHILLSFSLILIWLTALITNLKYLAPCSGLASACMISGIAITYYYASQDLPSVSERRYFSTIHQLPLFFGTAIFAFEGISLVLPLQNSMKKPSNFSKITGVLNVGMVFVTTIFISFGFIGYLKYGEDTKGSLTLNLPEDQILGQSVKLVIALGILLGYALQFFVAIQIMMPSITKRFTFTRNHPLVGELAFRTFMVLITFAIAELVPKLNLLLSLIGALCSTGLALVFPPVIQMVLTHSEGGLSKYIIVKNSIILFFALLGFATGTYESLSAIIMDFRK